MAVSAGMRLGGKVPLEAFCPSRRDTSPYLWWALGNEAEQLVAHHRLLLEVHPIGQERGLLA